MSSRPRRRSRTVAVAAAVTAATLAVTGCGSGFDAATNIEYVPADGISLDTGTVLARNLVVVADPGEPATLSLTLVNNTAAADTLVAAQVGSPAADGSFGGPGASAAGITVEPSSTVVVGAEGGPQVAFADAELQPGSWVPVTIAFAEGGEASGSALVRTTVVTTPSPAAEGHGDSGGH